MTVGGREGGRGNGKSTTGTGSLKAGKGTAVGTENETGIEKGTETERGKEIERETEKGKENGERTYQRLR